MLKYMEQLGSMGASRKVCLYSDGDGDFRPKFKIEESVDFERVAPVAEDDGNRLYDAG